MIRDALRSYRDAVDREASRAADEALHVTVARATHNPYLVSLSASIRSEISLGFGAEPYSMEIRRRALSDHGALAEAVADGAPERAADIARTHFAITETVLRALHERIGEPQATAEAAT